jgi:hypothetical protein
MNSVWPQRAQLQRPRLDAILPRQAEFANFQRFDWRPIVAGLRLPERYMLRRTDGVMAICPELHDHVLSSGYRGPLALIENTLDFETPAFQNLDVQSLREQLGVEGSKVVVYTGTLESYQGLELLVGAARMWYRGISFSPYRPMSW